MHHLERKYKGNGIFQCTAILLQFYACFARKCSVSQTLSTKMFDKSNKTRYCTYCILEYSLKRENRTENNIFQFFVIFHQFSYVLPQNMAFCNPKWITFLICLTKHWTVRDALTMHHLERKIIKECDFPIFHDFYTKIAFSPQNNQFPLFRFSAKMSQWTTLVLGMIYHKKICFN